MRGPGRSWGRAQSGLCVAAVGAAPAPARVFGWLVRAVCSASRLGKKRFWQNTINVMLVGYCMNGQRPCVLCVKRVISGMSKSVKKGQKGNRI